MDSDLQLTAEQVASTEPSTDGGAKLDCDVALDEAAQGTSETSEVSAVGTGEIDAIGHAAGFVVNDTEPFSGIEEIERRDAHRWELDPDSAETDFATD